MNVLMLADVEFPPDSRIEKEALALKSAGHDVVLICLKTSSSNSYKSIRLVRLPFRETSFPSPFNWVVDYLLYWLFGCLYAYVYSRGKHVVHVHNPPDFIVPFLMPLKLFGKKIIFDVHDPTHLLAMSRLKKPESHWLIKMLKLFFDVAVWSADYVITINPQFAALISKKAIIVPNCPGDEFFKNHSITRKPIAIYVGAMVPGRGLELLVKAMEKVEGDLLMVGRGEYLDYLKTIAPKNVKFIGEVPYSKVPFFLRKASVAVLPFEPTPINNLGSSNKLYEYMAFGMPIVCTDLPSTRRIAEGAALFVNYSEEDFVKGINKLFKDKSFATKLSKKAKERAKDYVWSKASQPLLLLYESIEGRY